MRLFRLAAPLVALLAAASCATVGPECATHGGAAWLQLDSEHFSLRTNLSEGEGKATTLQLERWLAVLRHAFPAAVTAGARTDVVVFSDTRDVQQLTGTTSQLGHTLRDWHGPMMMLGNTLYALESTTEDATLVHELTHVVAAQTLARQPRWLAEGLATYFETAKVDVTGSARTGDPVPSRLEAVRAKSHLPLEELWAWDTDPRSPDEDRALTDARYASSWLFVHYLYHRRERQLGRFLQGLAQGTAPRAAFAAAFPDLTPEQLDADAQRYVEDGKYRAHAFEISAVSEHVSVSPLSDATAHAVFARVAGAVHSAPDWKERARAELDAALALDPDDALARELDVLAATGPQALEAARALTVARSTEPRGWRLYALQLARAGALAEAYDALAQAAVLAPEDPDVLREQGGVLLALGRGDEALPVLGRAVSLAPHRYELQLGYALALAGAGRCPEALAAFVSARELLDERVDVAKFSARAQPVVDRCAGAPAPPPPPPPQ